MKETQLSIRITEYSNLLELNTTDSELVKQAMAISENAYAPYSNFKVGAAVLLKNGEIITGTNQENAAYPSGLCAERTALFYANSKFPDVPVLAIAIVAKSNNVFTEQPIGPCGSCRQVIFETETRFKSPIKIIMVGTKKISVIENAKSLLPISFSENDLKWGIYC